MKRFRNVVLLGVVLLVVFVLVGCGSDGDEDEYREPVSFVSVSPPGGEARANMTITVTFDGVPENVTVSAGTVKVVGKKAIISGPFTPGPIALTITWTDGTQALNYPVCCGIDDFPPEITGGTFEDGDTDVDPESLNTDGIEITFNEHVFGTIALENEAGEDVGWIGKVEDNKATLELVKGRELTTETTYVIRGKVSDAAGNATDVSVTFVTRLKG